MNFFLLQHYISHLFTSGYKNGHGIHSPFAYAFFRNVLFNKTKTDNILVIKKVRKELLKSKVVLETSTAGEPSKVFKSKYRSVSGLVKHTATKERIGLILNNLVSFYNLKQAVELGTSVGLGAIYLASGNAGVKVQTIEYCRNTADFAGSVFKANNITNIQLFNNVFEAVFPEIMRLNNSVDMVYIDGNHNFNSTMYYFNLCKNFGKDHLIVVFDDIYWSSEMLNAWKTIIKDLRVTLSIDLFYCGIVFFNPELTKKHYKVKL